MGGGGGGQYDHFSVLPYFPYPYGTGLLLFILLRFVMCVLWLTTVRRLYASSRKASFNKLIYVV